MSSKKEEDVLEYQHRIYAHGYGSFHETMSKY